MCFISGFFGLIRNWFKILLILLIVLIYWVIVEEKFNVENGFIIIKGCFVYKIWVYFSLGEIMFIEYDGKGVNEKGVFVVDVVIKGKMFKIVFDVEVKFLDFVEMFV